MDWVDGCLNAPFGARCFMTRSERLRQLQGEDGLNAPFGARCFMTYITSIQSPPTTCLNAPFGARCFMTNVSYTDIYDFSSVLMHRLALGAL